MRIKEPAPSAREVTRTEQLLLEVLYRLPTTGKLVNEWLSASGGYRRTATMELYESSAKLERLSAADADRYVDAAAAQYRTCWKRK